MSRTAEGTLPAQHPAEAAHADNDVLFESLDVGGKGYVTATDLTAAARAVGAPLSEAAAETLIQANQQPGSKSKAGLSAADFKTFVNRREADLAELFQRVLVIGGADATKAKLEFGTLALALAELGIAATGEELHDFVAKLDRDGDGAVSFREFRAWMLLQPVVSVRACFSRHLGDTRHDRMFRSFDSTGDGYVDAAELVTAARLASVPLSMAQAEAIIGGRPVSREGFKGLIRRREEDLRRVFDEMIALGAPEGGKLGPGALRRALSALGVRTSDRELRAFMHRVDTDSDGVISFREFRDFCTFLPALNAAACFEQVRLWGLEAADGQHTPPVETAPLDEHLGLAEKLLEKLVAGGAAGVCSRTATAPIDRVKLLMQAHSGEGTLSVGRAVAGIAREGGLPAFFRGNGANCVKVAPETAVRFLVFDLLKGMSSDPSAPTAAERFAAGGMAGACAQTIVYPLEIAKTRLALAPPGMYDGIRACVRKVWAQEGARALFAGLGPSIAGIVPYAAIDLGVNSMLKEHASRYYRAQGREPGVLPLLASGMTSSTTAMLSTYPLNLVRTRLQASGLPGVAKYDSAMDVVREAFQSNGPLGLYRGIIPNMAKVLPATSISYTVYGVVCERLSSRR